MKSEMDKINKAAQLSILTAEVALCSFVDGMSGIALRVLSKWIYKYHNSNLCKTPIQDYHTTMHTCTLGRQDKTSFWDKQSSKVIIPP